MTTANAIAVIRSRWPEVSTSNQASTISKVAAAVDARVRYRDLRNAKYAVAASAKNSMTSKPAHARS